MGTKASSDASHTVLKPLASFFVSSDEIIWRFP